MPEDNKEINPRRRISLGFIITILIAIAGIITLIYFMFFTNKTKEFTVEEFAKNLEE